MAPMNPRKSLLNFNGFRFNRWILLALPALLVLAIYLLSSWEEAAAATPAGPVKVELKKIDGRYQLYRGGKPYFIHGAGLEFGNVEKLAEHGGNSFRTWRTENGRQSGQEVLNRAFQSGLTVTMGLDVAAERHGFDYNNQEEVARQLERLKREVLKYKDHPSLLIWAIGNELNLSAKNPLVWNAVNDISRMIHEVDPNHLTTTALAGISKDLVREIQQRAPDLDLLSIQLYGDLVNLPRYLKETGWNGPYLVSEWGATGHWEVANTPWDAPIEDDSSVKADFYSKRFKAAIEPDKTQCLGSYVFLWGQKQERTPTWYGLFLESGEKTESVDVMHAIWTGHWPKNRSPRLVSARLDGKTASDGIYLQAGNAYPVEVDSTDPDGDALTYRWDVMPESTDLKYGGDFETTPKNIAGLVDSPTKAQATLTAPTKPGPYRLFIEALDGKGHAAHANIPFYVNE